VLEPFRIEYLMSNHGGRRPGAGRPKGSKTAETLAKEAAREVVRKQVIAELEPLIEAQIVAAMGDSHCFARDTATSQWRLIEDERLAARAEATHADGNFIRIFTADPSVRAFADLMDRALDKPRRQEQEIKVSGAVDIVHRLMAARRPGRVSGT
jgi:hypothetical protein